MIADRFLHEAVRGGTTNRRGNRGSSGMRRDVEKGGLIR